MDGRIAASPGSRKEPVGNLAAMGLRIVVAVAGTLVILATLSSAIRTVILPRGVQSTITRAVFVGVRVPFRAIAHDRRSYEDRDRVMAVYAPVALALLPLAWLALEVVGFTLLFQGLTGSSFGDAYHLSGSSITTLGFAPADGVLVRTVAFAEAAVGLFLVALLISYLPSLYSSFSQREAMVATLATRAGTPPSARDFMVRHHAIGWLDDLGEFWLAWERWFAEVEESHTSYPMLAFFRSPAADRSWITAAGAVLDSASFYVSTIEQGDSAPASVCIRSGYLALRHIAGFFGIAHDEDPAPTDPISITRAEFDEMYEAIEEVGVALVSDRDQAWRDFVGWRVNYDTVLIGLADLTMAPYAPWSSDRSTADRRRFSGGLFRRSPVRR
jgi:hypothetical protein